MMRILAGVIVLGSAAWVAVVVAVALDETRSDSRRLLAEGVTLAGDFEGWPHRPFGFDRWLREARAHLDAAA